MKNALLLTVLLVCSVSGVANAATAVYGIPSTPVSVVDNRAQPWLASQNAQTAAQKPVMRKDGMTSLINQLKSMIKDFHQKIDRPAIDKAESK